jgi:hypothetical protein
MDNVHSRRPCAVHTVFASMPRCRCGCGCLHHRQDGYPSLGHGPDGLDAVVRSRWPMSPVDVDVSIIDKMATFLSVMDLTVLMTLSVLASLHVSRCEFLHHREDGHPSHVHGPAGLVAVVQQITRSHSPNPVHTARMDGWMELCCCCCCQRGISRFYPAFP